jgi:polyisoprenoid-binding protein YceI
MKKTAIMFALVLAATASFAQKKTTTSGTVTFDATTEKDALPKADNKTAIAKLDTKTGEVAFETTVKNFTFANPKMQEHFNGAGWMDSDKYPTATFKGAITNLKAINFSKDGTYKADVSGDLTIHGVTQKASTTATLVVAGKKVTSNSAFSVKLADYKIDNASLSSGKVSTEPKVTVMAEFN